MGKGLRFGAVLLCGGMFLNSGCAIFSARGDSPAPVTPPVYSAGPLPSAPMNPIVISDPNPLGVPSGTIIYPANPSSGSAPEPNKPIDTLPLPKGDIKEKENDKDEKDGKKEGKIDEKIPTVILDPMKTPPPALVIPTITGQLASTPKTETKPTEGALGSGLKLPPLGPTIPGTIPAKIPPAQESSKPQNDGFTPASKIPEIKTPTEIVNTPKVGTDSMDSLPIPPDMKLGRHPKFNWLVGSLDKHHKGYWTLRYADFSSDDPWGGKVRLSDDARLNQFKDGDIIFVEGELLVPLNWKPDSNTPYPPFRIKSLKLLNSAR